MYSMVHIILKLFLKKFYNGLLILELSSTCSFDKMNDQLHHLIEKMISYIPSSIMFYSNYRDVLSMFCDAYCSYSHFLHFREYEKIIFYFSTRITSKPFRFSQNIFHYIQNFRNWCYENMTIILITELYAIRWCYFIRSLCMVIYILF